MIVARIDAALDVLRQRGLVDADRVIDLLLDMRPAAQFAEVLLGIQEGADAAEVLLPGLADL